MVQDRTISACVANHPATRLHSQFDFGGHSSAMNQRDREVVRSLARCTISPRWARSAGSQPRRRHCCRGR